MECVRMNFKSKIERVGIIAGVMMGLLVVNPATASVVGSMSLDITGGCFSTDGVDCGNTDDTRQAYATGNFSFTDTLLSAYGGTTGLAQQSFSYTGIVDMEAALTPAHLFPSLIRPEAGVILPLCVMIRLCSLV